MPKLNWKSLFLLVPVTIVGAVILVGGIFSTMRLPVFTWSGLAPFVVLIGITLISSRFTVRFTNVDGSSQSHKSVADAFIFLAVMMYTTPPANTDRKSTRLNSSHRCISYAVLCLKKKE